MKKIFILALTAIMSYSYIFAQFHNAPTQYSASADRSITSGVLGNGLSYYIKENTHTSNTASFYLVTNVGASQEKDNQKGMAHFIERMAFNGTELFSFISMLEYLQENGIEYNKNVKSKTNMDYTQFSIENVSTNRSSRLIDSCILILKDRSEGVLLHNSEINKQRINISKEIINTNNATFNLYEKRMKDIGAGTYVENINVMGSLDCLDKFEYSNLNDFYKTWHRPDLQAIIVVGNINVSDIEAKIKRYFTPILKTYDPVEKSAPRISDLKETVAINYIDKRISEINFCAITQTNSSNIEANKNFSSEIRRFYFKAINEIFNNRLKKLAHSSDASITFTSQENIIPYANNEFAVTSANLKPGKELDGIELIGKEIRRLKNQGVTTSEIRTIKKSLEKQNNLSYANSFNKSDNDIAEHIISHFTYYMPLTSSSAIYEANKKLIAEISKPQFAGYISQMFKSDNYYLSVGSPKSRNISENDVVTAFNKGYISTPSRSREMFIDESIVNSDSAESGKIISETFDGYDSYIWTFWKWR